MNQSSNGERPNTEPLVATTPAGNSVSGLSLPSNDAIEGVTSEVGEVPEANATRLSWPHLYLGALGFAISLYALRVHNIVARGGDGGCGFTETINCHDVLASKYAVLFGIPLGAFGMAYFIVVIMTGVTTNARTTDLQAATWRLLVTGAGLCGSLTLTYISLVKIKVACPICLSTHAVVFVLFLISMFQFFKARRTALAADASAG